ncbi:MAG: glycosyltransferase [Microgenomates group bacterium GW2011_GWC1_46_16]|nr:MAG: putative glycosyltransferase [Microgenomates group bacterium GW2011_GWF1_46_12]KKU26501.1 MAG: glycosyltransferase [Microgenomates group bacterium GW2011_GWC1_46_16]KKU27735.1 MAG: putative glycosyltransferase [Microgenomates group bacterium GW2011_GWF2_46_18]KKU43015.1 MAG: putative glycosyltransferase [Microgenomates group bacterium GW2011_GWA1_46_7]KKU45020.1 MAG: putative glycosyltransferase [Microgenomates group bacterium GW2011_GWB1_46_7]KKU60131.1 MAG: putative glycosyltransfera
MIHISDRMSTKKIAIFQNLPTGGGNTIYEEIKRYLDSKYKVQVFSDNISNNDVSLINILIYSFKNFFFPKKRIIDEINSSDIFIGFHSWITKSPIYMRGIRIPKIYFCNETMREFYEYSHKKIQTPKEKIINFIRLPLKYFNYINTRSSDIIISDSKKTNINISKAYGVTSKIIYPGVNIPIYRSRSIRKKNQIISVGAINRLKGFEVIVKSTGMIPKNRRPKLLIVGNGSNISYEKYLIKLAMELSVDLSIKVNISNKQLNQHYSESQLFVYTPIEEPFGMVVLEAMSYGLPIVASNTGGYTEILDKKTGILVEARDPKLISVAIKTILGNKSLYNTYAKHVKQVAKRFSYNRVLQQLDNIIHHLQ